VVHRRSQHLGIAASQTSETKATQEHPLKLTAMGLRRNDFEGLLQEGQDLQD